MSHELSLTELNLNDDKFDEYDNYEFVADNNISDENVLKIFKKYPKLEIINKFEGKMLTGENKSNCNINIIKKELELLKTVPDGIITIASESNINLYKTLILGPKFTPYYNSLFIFDCTLSSAYPNSPPKFLRHAYNVRANPNLYACGKVCLSLLGTWPGEHESEKWQPNNSSIYQIILSVQSLILGENEPIKNEPGMSGYNFNTKKTSKKDIEIFNTNVLNSRLYNETTLILVLSTMDSQLQSPVPEFKKIIIEFCRYLYKRWDLFLSIAENAYKFFYKTLEMKQEEINKMIQIFSWYGIFIKPNDIIMYLKAKKNNIENIKNNYVNTASNSYQYMKIVPKFGYIPTKEFLSLLKVQLRRILNNIDRICMNE